MFFIVIFGPGNGSLTLTHLVVLLLLLLVVVVVVLVTFAKYFAEVMF